MLFKYLYVIPTVAKGFDLVSYRTYYFREEIQHKN